MHRYIQYVYIFIQYVCIHTHMYHTHTHTRTPGAPPRAAKSPAGSYKTDIDSNIEQGAEALIR